METFNTFEEWKKTREGQMIRKQLFRTLCYGLIIGFVVGALIFDNGNIW